MQAQCFGNSFCRTKLAHHTFHRTPVYRPGTLSNKGQAGLLAAYRQNQPTQQGFGLPPPNHARSTQGIQPIRAQMPKPAQKALASYGESSAFSAYCFSCIPQRAYRPKKLRPNRKGPNQSKARKVCWHQHTRRFSLNFAPRKNWFRSLRPASKAEHNLALPYERMQCFP